MSSPGRDCPTPNNTGGGDRQRPGYCSCLGSPNAGRCFTDDFSSGGHDHARIRAEETPFFRRTTGFNEAPHRPSYVPPTISPLRSVPSPTQISGMFGSPLGTPTTAETNQSSSFGYQPGLYQQRQDLDGLYRGWEAPQVFNSLTASRRHLSSQSATPVAQNNTENRGRTEPGHNSGARGIAHGTSHAPAVPSHIAAPRSVLDAAPALTSAAARLHQPPARRNVSLDPFSFEGPRLVHTVAPPSRLSVSSRSGYNVPRLAEPPSAAVPPAALISPRGGKRKREDREAQEQQLLKRARDDADERIGDVHFIRGPRSEAFYYDGVEHTEVTIQYSISVPTASIEPNGRFGDVNWLSAGSETDSDVDDGYRHSGRGRWDLI
ncbi:predicted protein [Verticillium alfalfae VaMs.102]|uniref:Predicted protein n=1 Tax=Verticillium alfalfae (strain VaMs.102 / ATCC MYA-4576 / FGSC 10136) TaxID=526221 RepID=C9SD32_VERA1|nr:predicted protein [Verticillium alfalfae VaMs.102]EEY16997.1 predicted protein [Verticillium alfalfae VaMs.102]